MKHLTVIALGTLVVLSAGTPAWAQRRPSNGACFYEDINYGGRYFCYATGAELPRVPPGTDDEISSIRLFGNAEVTVFKDSNYRGTSRRFTSSINDLRRAGLNDRITSARIDRRGSGNNWGGAYGGGGWGGSGSGYGGDYGNGQWGGAYGGGSHGGGWSKSNGSRYTYQQAQEIVRRAYRNVLERDPDPAARSWVNAVMEKNMSQRQLEAELRKSAEYRNKQR